MRPGRLDRILYVGPPDLEGRIEILRIRTQKMSVEAGLDLEQIARMVRTPRASSLLMNFSTLIFMGIERRMFRGRDSGIVPRGRAADYEDGHKRAIRKLSFSLPLVR